jgi:hypothetical protein
MTGSPLVFFPAPLCSHTSKSAFNKLEMNMKMTKIKVYTV